MACDFSIARVRCRRGFTLVELLIVVVIIIMLVALLLPTIGAARARMAQSACASQQKQLLQGMLIANSNLGPGKKVNHTDWTTAIVPFLEEGGEEIFHCPADFDSESLSPSYGMTHVVGRMGDEDGRKIVMLDYNKTTVQVVVASAGAQDNWATSHAPRHLDQVNVAYHDTGTQAMDPTFIDPKVCVYYAKHWRPYRLAWMELVDCLDVNEGTGSGIADGSTDTTTESTDTTTGTSTDTTTGDGDTTDGAGSGATLCELDSTLGLGKINDYSYESAPGVKWVYGNESGGGVGGAYVIDSTGELRPYLGAAGSYGDSLGHVGIEAYNDPSLLHNASDGMGGECD